MFQTKYPCKTFQLLNKAKCWENCSMILIESVIVLKLFIDYCRHFTENQSMQSLFWIFLTMQSLFPSFLTMQSLFWSFLTMQSLHCKSLLWSFKQCNYCSQVCNQCNYYSILSLPWSFCQKWERIWLTSCIKVHGCVLVISAAWN